MVRGGRAVSGGRTAVAGNCLSRLSGPESTLHENVWARRVADAEDSSFTNAQALPARLATPATAGLFERRRQCRVVVFVLALGLVGLDPPLGLRVQAATRCLHT